MPSDSDLILLTTAPNTTAASQILYGLELRSISARVVENRKKSMDPLAIVLVDGDEQIAREAIGYIWDTMLETTPRATDVDGNCYFCGYDIHGLEVPVTCPECGNNVDSIEARRAASEGR
jgi:rubrerythrin